MNQKTHEGAVEAPAKAKLGRKRMENKILEEGEDYLVFDAATKTFPNASFTIDKDNRDLVLDGHGRWSIAKLGNMVFVRRGKPNKMLHHLVMDSPKGRHINSVKPWPKAEDGVLHFDLRRENLGFKVKY